MAPPSPHPSLSSHHHHHQKLTFAVLLGHLPQANPHPLPPPEPTHCEPLLHLKVIPSNRRWAIGAPTPSAERRDSNRGSTACVLLRLWWRNGM